MSRRLRLGQIFSHIGSVLSLPALVLLAGWALHADLIQMGILVALKMGAELLLWAPARRLVGVPAQFGLRVAANLGRGLVSGLVLLLVLSGHVSLEILALGALLFGAFETLNAPPKFPMSHYLRPLDPRSFFVSGVARSRSFRTFWIGQGVSQLGSAVSLAALPLIAAIIVGVTPAQMGILVALETVPALLWTIPAGILADRTDRRVVLIAADLGRALAVGLVPLAALTGHLSFEIMALVAFVMGSLGIVFDVTYEGFMTEVIEIEDLTEGFQKMEITASGARIVGPGVGGVLLTVVGVALTIGIDAVSYLISAVSLFLTHRRPNLVPPVSVPTSFRDELTRGMRLVFGDRVLRDLALATGLINLGAGFAITLVVIFATRNLGLSAGEYGLLYSLTSVGFLLGASQIGRLSRRFGTGRGLTVAGAVMAISMLMIPLASPGLGVAFLALARFLNTVSNTSFNILLLGLRQTRADPAFRSRITSAFRLISWGALPIGSLIGGALADPLGITGALVVGGIMPVVGVIILRVGPVWRVNVTDDFERSGSIFG